MRHTVKTLARYLRPRKRKGWDDVPTGWLTILGLMGTLEAGYYGYVLQKFGPEFLDVVNAQPLASWQNATFLAYVGILSAVGFLFFIWSVAAAGLAALLQKRLFGT